MARFVWRNMPKSVPMPAELVQRIVSVMQYDTETGEFTRPDRRPGHIGSMRKAGWLNDVGYRMFAFEGRDFLAHRVVWAIYHGDPGPLYIDHINGIRSDNRLSNLRATTQIVNMQNLKRPHSDSTSGVLGVSWSKSKSKWVVRMRVGTVYRFFGYYADVEDARRAYLEAKRRLHPGCTI